MLSVLDQPPRVSQLLVNEHPRPLLGRQPGIVGHSPSPPAPLLTTKGIFHPGYDSTNHQRPTQQRATRVDPVDRKIVRQRL